MEDVRSRDGTAIAFDRTGEGPPIILVGGAIQHRAMDQTTARLAALLAPRFTVFHYNRRGRGDSGDPETYAVEREVEDLEALVEEAGGSAHLYGMSSGGALALEAAARGVAATKLALYELPFMVGDDGAPAPEDFATRLSELTASGRRGDPVELFLSQGPGVPAEVIAQMRSEPIWPAMESVAHTLVYDMKIMDDQESLLALRAPSVMAPTLVIDGGASPPWMRNAAQTLAERLPNSQHRTLEGQTHQASPEALAPVLVEFFAG
jgi:pimeloyl-ACP methyl ester carboxylesterase